MATKQTHTTKGKVAPAKHGKGHHAKVYWPYIPLIALLIGGAFMNIWQPLQVNNQRATLAYATEMSRSGLLSSTNTKRAENGSAALSLNSSLNAAAQAKANDMINRDYWSHNTPDGEQPWVFIEAQGYSYTKAGENLAYGFDTSNETIIGWMNSTMGHRENMLDTTFTEVGFGFTNGANFNASGNQTVVVAMYAKPVVLSAQTTPEPTPQPAATPAPAPAAEPEPEPEPVVEAEPEFVPVSEALVNQPFTTDLPADTEPTESTRITLLQQLTGGDMPWIALVLSLGGFALAMVWLFKHYVLVRRFIIEGEHFVAHHPILDLIVVSVIALIVYLSQTTGVIL